MAAAAEPTTTDQLIDRLKVDVDKSRGSGDSAKRVVLICVDSSESSIYACEWASKNMLTKKDIVVLMTVWEELMDLSLIQEAAAIDPVGLLTVDPVEIKKHNLEHLDEAKKLLLSVYDSYLKGCHSVMPLLVSSTHHGKGYIGKLVISASDVLSSDLIITGARGLSKLESLLLGSVSKHIVEHAKCPVLVVKH